MTENMCSFTHVTSPVWPVICMGSFPEQRLGMIIDSNLYNNVFMKLFSWSCSFSMHHYSQPPARWYTLSVKTSIDPLQLVCHVVQMTTILEKKRRTKRRQTKKITMIWALHLACTSTPVKIFFLKLQSRNNFTVFIRFYTFVSTPSSSLKIISLTSLTLEFAVNHVKSFSRQKPLKSKNKKHTIVWNTKFWLPSCKVWIQTDKNCKVIPRWPFQA